jgi:hypothetical protein
MNIKQLSIACILPSALILFTTAPARSVTLLTDNFNAENGGVGVANYTNFTNWIAGGVSLDGNGFNDVLPGNGLYADFNAGGGILTSKSRLTFNAGDTLTLSLKIATVGSGTIGVAQIGDVFGVNMFNSVISPQAANAPFLTISRTINITSAMAQQAAAVPQFLFLQSTNNTTGRLLLDDIVLTSTPAGSTSVPEPSTIPGLLLFCASLFGLKKLFRQVNRVTR